MVQMAALGLSASCETPLAYAPLVRQDLVMLEVTEDILQQACSCG